MESRSSSFLISSRKSPETAPAPCHSRSLLMRESSLVFSPSLQDAALVQPVRRDPVLRGLVHRVGADLDLDDLSLVPHHGGVQALVAVGLRHGDVVLEPPLDGHPELVHEARAARSTGWSCRTAPAGPAGRRSPPAACRAGASSGRSSRSAWPASRSRWRCRQLSASPVIASFTRSRYSARSLLRSATNWRICS